MIDDNVFGERIEDIEKSLDKQIKQIQQKCIFKGASEVLQESNKIIESEDIDIEKIENPIVAGVAEEQEEKEEQNNEIIIQDIKKPDDEKEKKSDNNKEKEGNFFTKPWKESTTGEKVGFVFAQIGLLLLTGGVFTICYIIHKCIKNGCACYSKESVNTIGENKKKQINK